MANHKNQDQTDDTKPAGCCGPETRSKGRGRNRSFIEGCLYGLCCCWLWNACLDA